MVLSKTFLFQAIQFSQTVLFPTIQFSICIVFDYTELDFKTVLFQAIQFSIVQFCSIWPIDWTLSGPTTPSQSRNGSNGNEGVLHIIGTSPSDCLVSCPGHSLGAVTPL